MRKVHNQWFFAAAIVLPLVAVAQAPDPVTIRDTVEANRDAAVSLYREFLALPNDAVYAEDIERLVTWMEGAFAGRGFETEQIPTDGSPALLAQRLVPGAKKTVLVYLQADGQPVDPSAWEQPDPYAAVLKERDELGQWRPIPWDSLAERFDPEWRVFARSASDSKGPMTQFLMAMQLLDELDAAPQYNLKVLIDTEEEMGSPNLAPAVKRDRELLAADFLLIFDGPPHASNRPTVKFGARGIVTVTLETYGPKVAQHSGHYGNFLPNPVFDLARIIASLKDEAGRVTLDGFYDGIEITPAVRELLEAVPDDEAAILASAGVARADAVAPSLQEALQYPSLNVRGIRAAWVGDEARTIIPPKATAEIDIRLVKESDPERLISLLRDHVTGLGFHLIESEPTDDERRQHPKLLKLTYDVSYGAYRSDFDAPAGLMARAGMRHLYGEEPILIRNSGGSIPIAPLVETLGIPAASVPTVNIDNNQHSPNENIRLGSFLEGIAILMAVLSQDPD
ncbi:MAG: M20/M25/M40 family metallo-hydrolase [Woeseiaceae bacterium]|nr:M20/M25/M40 family metallo-hydrolase [Woeseiaceae bacterium]NIP20400.1 M20/M25/M40 family metallo-hydrolase [Woeseiaceae bacterium]NIS89289.1 M20/M25/M40 family metallo-hydrolase [Woeseiaceae bacterium]